MNAIVITNENQILNSLSHTFFPSGINIVHFKKCANATNFIQKIDPSIVIVDTDLEPRAWKPLITVLKSGQSSHPIVFLLISTDCDLETANQALFLGVNGILLKPFTKNKSMPRVIKLIKRHIDINANRSYVSINPNIEDSIIFVYNDILNRKIHKGQIIEITAMGMAFTLKANEKIYEFENGKKLENTIIKIKGYEIKSDIYFMSCKPPLFKVKFVNLFESNYDPLYIYLLEKISLIFEMNKGFDQFRVISVQKPQK